MPKATEHATTSAQASNVIPFPGQGARVRLMPRPKRAKVLTLIERYRALVKIQHGLIEEASRHPEKSPKARHFWQRAMACWPERKELEKQICLIRAVTPEAVRAKLEVAYINLDGDDPRMEGTIWSVPISAARDAMAFLQQLKGVA